MTGRERFFRLNATRVDAVLFAALVLAAALLVVRAEFPADRAVVEPIHEATLPGLVSSGVNRGRIDINSADEALLMELPGIGETLAGRIVEYRIQNGPYNSIEELTNVKGIGEGRISAIQDLICALAPD